MLVRRAAAAQAQAQAAAANKSADDAREARERLRAQLNSVLATARRLSRVDRQPADVLFDTGNTLSNLRLRSAGEGFQILQAYPG